MTDWAGLCVAITGASGFLGSALVERARSRGAAVRGLSRSRPPSRSGVTWIRGDVRDSARVEELVRGADVVVHAASVVHRRARGDAFEAELWDVNVDGTDRVARAAGARPLVYISSTAVFGAAPGPWTEDTVCQPVTPYGRSKLAAEGLVLQLDSSAVVRPSAIVGAGAPGSFRLLDRLVRLPIVPLVGGGRARKSLTHVSTVASVVSAIVDRLLGGKTRPRVFVATDDAPYSVREVARARAEAVGRSPLFLDLSAGWLRVSGRLLDEVAAQAGCSRMPSLSSLLDTFCTDAVADNRSMREVLRVTAAVTAGDYLRSC